MQVDSFPVRISAFLFQLAEHWGSCRFQHLGQHRSIPQLLSLPYISLPCIDNIFWITGVSLEFCYY